jgi:2-amino-4-hydroxy-6-hydroxymethyldihydropteridine diphosphokinase
MMHPTVARAAQGELPDWASASKKRRAHMSRVADLMGKWAEQLAPAELDRWRAAGWLHDALRDARADDLRPLLNEEFQSWPSSLLHGPASASRLLAEGVDDEDLLNAVRYHTMGSPVLQRIGHALYMADYLEPGRTYAPSWRSLMRARMPEHFDDVLRAVIHARLETTLQKGSPVRAETAEFWNSVVRR